MPTTSPLARHWALDPRVDYLNHGSFGACPREVLAAQQRLREEMEAEPVDFLARQLGRRLDAARDVLADFLGADADGLVAVPNATTGVNAVLQSLAPTFGPDDELLITDHGYNACRNVLAATAAATGARVVVAPVPFPLAGPEEIVAAVLGAVSSRTRLALLDHVTSPTALVFPIERLVAELAARGVDTLVDGAHAPGMVALDVRAIGAAYYTGNCHKWLCAPKGAAFLWARADRRDALRPPITSHGFNRRRPGRSRFHDEFDWMGTGDPTAFLCVPESLRVLAAMAPGGWPEVMERNRALALRGRAELAAAVGCPPPCPESMVGSMAALPLPAAPAAEPPSPLGFDPLQDLLLARHRIEVPVNAWPAPPARLLRISAQLYNDLEQYVRLGRTLVAELVAAPAGG